MRVNVEWLRQWAPVEADAEAIAAALTASGLEVESVEPVAGAFEGVVVGHVQTVEPHPNADRLRVCTVDDGRGVHTVVCGAPNVAPGMKVPFATVGAALPEGKRIGAAELRGVRSAGMLCSAKELGLGEEGAGLLVLDRDAVIGADLRQQLRLDDSVLDVNVTPNRGDCFSVLGIARELAARSAVPLRQPEPRAAKPAISELFAVELRAGEHCPRFVGRVVRGLRTGLKSPLWLRERLRRAGVRAIHPVVDVTNYVMLELGQPLHAYDLGKLDRYIEVRFASADESLVLLGGERVQLEDDVLVIADARGPIGLAGIMGGQSTAVDAASEAIFFEAAYFSPSGLAGRARRYALHTEASQRFERGVDPSGQTRAIERATELLASICGGDVGPLVVAERPADVPRRTPVALRRERIEAVLGMTVSGPDVEQLLARLEMRVEPDGEGWRVTPPAFRFDIAIEEDLIEEVGRMLGYDRIPSTPGVAVATLGTATERRVPSADLAATLAARGYAEIVTYTFIDPALEEAVNPGTEPVRLANPIASDMAVLRRSLWPGLIGAAERNVNHQRARFKLFEIGPQFETEASGVCETAVLAGLAMGSRTPEHWDGAAPDLDYFDVKGDVEALLKRTGEFAAFGFEPAAHPALAPGRSARIVRRGNTVGWLGALHPTLQNRLDRKRSAIVFALKLDAAFAATIPALHTYSRFPSLRRDLALVVDETVSAGALVATATAAGGALLKTVVVFDVYRGSGVDSRRKSIGLGLILQDASRTLTDADADQTVRTVALRLERELGATIRT